MEFRHFLLTRFNIKLARKKQDKNLNLVNDKDWLEDRFVLFERFCFPSIRNQTNVNFRWLVFFDVSTSEEYIGLIYRYKDLLKNFEPVFTTEIEFIADARRIIGADSHFVITTTIDNDDAFHQDAVQSIQNHFDRQEFQFLNFLKGYQYDTERKTLGVFDMKSNPFITLIEKTDGMPKTVFMESHHKIGDFYPVHDICDKRYWLQVIHGRNLKNRSVNSARTFRLLKNKLRTRPSGLWRELWDVSASLLQKKAILREFGVDAVF